MLGTLSMIYRQRDKADLSLTVLEMEEAVLEIYAAHVEATPVWNDRANAELCRYVSSTINTVTTISRESFSPFLFWLLLQHKHNVMFIMCTSSRRDTLIFKKNLIKNNLMMMLGKQLEWGPTIFRQLAGYEAKYGATFDDQMFLFMLGIPEVNKEPTLRNVERLTDAECYAIVRTSMSAEALRAMDARESPSILRLCAACGTKEGAIGDFNPCACKTVFYCGVECQAQHRKAHKKACKKALLARLRTARKRVGRKGKGRR